MLYPDKIEVHGEGIFPAIPHPNKKPTPPRGHQHAGFRLDKVPPEPKTESKKVS